MRVTPSLAGLPFTERTVASRLPHGYTRPPVTPDSPKPAAPVQESVHDQYFGHEHLTVIEPARRLELVDLRELWAYRELLWTLAQRQISLRYKQTVLGAAWAIIQPALSMVAFTVLFGRMAKMPSEGFPYPIFVYSALLPWVYFTNASGSAVSSLVNSSHLISKVYFPRIVIPLASVLAALVDLAVASTVLAALMVFYGVGLTAQVLWVPLLVLGLVLTVTGIGAGLGALNVSYRDLTHVLPFLMQLWLYVTPVVYPSSAAPPALRLVLQLNPLSGLIEGFRAAVLGQPPDFSAIGRSLAVALLMFVAGMLYFHAVERRFADVV